jgi:amino acid transporter, AAT family
MASSSNLEPLEREAGLARQLSSRQMAMIAIGGAIGTGLFLGSALAVRAAGPAVIVSYLAGAVIALLLVRSLAEMAVAHPTAGSFGVYAELYVSRWAGFAVRYTYWAAQCIAIGGEAAAAGIYCRWWFPQIPEWAWVAAFSLLLIFVNAWGVGSFGEFEYWFAMIKVAAIVLFLLFGAAVLVRSGLARAAVPHQTLQGAGGFGNYTAYGGFFPHGLAGAWMALAFVIFSYIGTEVVAVTAGEAREPERAVPRAMRSMLGRLAIFYVGAMAVLVGVVPWTRIEPSGDITASPFVTVFQLMHIPAATHLMNFVVLTAALSSMNCDLYLATRMMFSLARSEDAPRALGRLTRGGRPLAALAFSSLGLAVATLVALRYPAGAYVYLLGIALFGGLFVWIMIFLTHLFFRRAWRRSAARLPMELRGYPYAPAAGLVLLVAILATTWWVEGMRVTLLAGAPWLALVTLAYLLLRARAKQPV